MKKGILTTLALWLTIAGTGTWAQAEVADSIADEMAADSIADSIADEVAVDSVADEIELRDGSRSSLNACRNGHLRKTTRTPTRA